MNRLALILVLFFIGAFCSAEADTQGAVNEYFDTYAHRKDFDKFMAFYTKQAILKDVVYGVELHGRKEIRNFFDWSRGEFKTVSPGPILRITSHVISSNIAISRGIFEEFDYNKERLGPWEFVIWQEFNDSGKIVRQDDWINYSPKKILIGTQDVP
jgi:hypothetical protein